MTTNSIGSAGKMTRRAMLCSAGVTSLSACVAWPKLPSLPAGALPIADAHVHLFNASDLPVVAFIKHVVIREHFPAAGRYEALIDMFLTIVKPWSMSAQTELGLRVGLSSELPYRSEDEYVDAIVARADLARRRPELLDVAGSYDFILRLLQLVYGEKVEPTSTLSEISDAERRAILVRVMRGEELRTLAVNISPDGLVDFAAFGLTQAEALLAIEGTASIIRWGYLMMLPRTRHLQTYLATYDSAERAPRLLMNFLVDYDRWLDDGPLTASSHDKQIELWSSVRGHYRDSVDIRTFAGYCPLKHAMESKRAGSMDPPHFARLQNALGKGQITGFKLYPPMGFQALGNAQLSNTDFEGEDGVRRGPLDAWLSVADREASLGSALDDALRHVYRLCEGKHPVVAHAGPSNAPAKGFEQRANPAYWGLVHKEFPRLRIGLGHFAHDARKFTKAMESGAGSSMWALTSLADVLRSGDGVIYADLGYTEELIDPDAAAEDLPCRFFEQLKRYCQGGDGWQAVDPTMTQIMLGSDWIMLGQEERHTEYLSVIDKALTAARWEDWERANLLHNNARRFLSMPV